MKEIPLHLHNPSFFSYQGFFSDDAIIEYLCHQRMSYSRKAHERGYFDRLTPGAPNEEMQPKWVLHFMPPRSQWIRAPERKRKFKQLRNQHTSDLRYTVKYLRKKNDPRDKPWILAQDKLIESVQHHAFNPIPEQRFKLPEILPQKKTPSSDEYRVIGHYSDVIEALLIGQCANYLRHVFEYYFSPCSFAFRASIDPISTPPTQHDAFEKIAEFWNKHQKDGLIQAYVVECDIQGFYDTVDHKVVLRYYDRAIDELSQKGIAVDTRARTFLINYLSSYSYNEDGRPKALSLLGKDLDSHQVKNRDETIRHLHRNVESINYGVLQGGALSNFFANLLLHEADKAVLKVIKPHQDVTTYVRYCDDMIIVGLKENIVREAAQKYIETLTKLKLAHHPLKPLQYTDEKESQRKFWNGKSKLTYPWKKKGESQSWVPWLAFVGYHLRYDGLVRVRPESLKNELRKQVSLTDRFLRSVLPAIKKGKSAKSIKELLSSLEYRLRASAIGRQHEWNLSRQETECCWFAGFRGLTSPLLPENQPIALTQLRQLDRGLGRQLTRARYILSKYSDLDPQKQTKKKHRRLRFLGKPRSYSGQLPN